MRGRSLSFAVQKRYLLLHKTEERDGREGASLVFPRMTLSASSSALHRAGAMVMIKSDRRRRQRLLRIKTSVTVMERVRSNAVASTSSSSSSSTTENRRRRNKDDDDEGWNRRGDSIATRAMSMSSSDENEDVLAMRNQFSKNLDVGRDGDGMMSGNSNSTQTNGASSRDSDPVSDNSASSTSSPSNSISSFMQEGGAYNAQLGKEKPLKINQDLLIEEAKRIRNQSLYARTRKERKKLRDAAIETFKRAIAYDQPDGRAYLGTGKIYVLQRDFNKAREVYEYGTRATGSENA